MAPYINYYNSAGTPFPPRPPIPTESSQVTQTNVINHAVIPVLSTPTLSAPQAAVKAFCDKYDFGDEEREGLRKLGFQISDDLDTVTEGEWVLCGMAPLHWRRVLLAWNTEKLQA